jgi:putative hydrolase of the HAD superfamily
MIGAGFRERAILLDLDDTLYEERTYFESGLAAVADWMSDYHLATAESWRARLLQDALAHGRSGVLDRIPCPADKTAEGWRAALLQVYRTHIPTLTLFPDVDLFIARARLEGCLLGLVTDGKSCMQWRKLAALGFERRLDAVVCSDDLDTAKPSTRPFLAAAALMGVPPQACAYLADDPSKDFIAPNLLGMATIQVRRTLAHPLARPAPNDAAEARCRVGGLDEAVDLLFGGAS